MSHSKIFLLGATGYIGGIVLLELIKRKDCHITALVRSEDKARKLQALNLGPVKVVLGSADDAAAIDACLENADVVIDTFNCDDVKGTTTLLTACKKLNATTKRKIPLIHVEAFS
ncbi:NAD(P)-binding protein [Cylindrobasidium torrendii FP15055 ss-10]|uniref:NAD(P)-binding protein n=1 Tax=Cylindrobasidium torrendii FP15055 ss-10 TaxID=1314674 RepID=A0A0D7BL45_9AGAR|nr:NAD(P)-binding protein [Cylindrobasidium torrendii FP15055 ss-10]